ncbi:MAG: porin [Ignavibacteria bacterium]
MRKITVLVSFLLALSFSAFAQSSHDNESDTLATKEEVQNVKGAVEGLNESYLETKAVVDAIKKIKISGYIQAQYQSAEVDGAKSFAGGDFPVTLHNRFAVRRGRVKFNYDNDLTQYVLQFDVTEKGMGIKDAYVSVKEPWLKTFGFTAGVFDRPFGFEISYSSSNRETPERTRMYQTLFPGERDLGAKIEIFPTSGPLSLFNFKGGFFAGNGTTPETDNAKDFIGRLGFSFPFEASNLAIDGGISGYFGSVLVDAVKKTYTLNSSSVPVGDSLSKYIDRNYLGADVQLYYDLPVLGGFSLRGEYISGKNPGTSTSNAVYKQTNGDVYLRNFSGYYINYVQNIGSSLQLVVKYDVFDPNSDVKGDDIGVSGSKLSVADLKYNTLGAGFVYYWDGNVKFTFYYDTVSNEKVNANAVATTLAPYKSDLKDNVFTLRMQYKF